MADLVQGTENCIIVGKREYGKTTLLRQLALSLINQSDPLGPPAAPCLVDFSDIKRGSNRFYRLLRAQLPETDGYSFTFSDLVKHGNLVVLIDDVDFSDSSRRDIISDFIQSVPLR